MQDTAQEDTDHPAEALAVYDLKPPVQAFALPDAGGINNRTRGVRTGAGPFVWKTYLAHRAPAAIRYEHRLLAWLAQQPLSFATPCAIPTWAGDTLCRTLDSTLWQALFIFLPGRPLDRSNLAHIEAFGAALAELHGVLRGYPMDPVPDLTAYAVLEQIHPAIPDPYALTPGDFGLPPSVASNDVLARWRTLLDATRAFIAGPYRTLPRQVIHGDVTPGNAFADDGRIAAIFDFEFAMPDARAIDVASGLTYVMRIWERDDAAALAMAHRFYRGYRQRDNLTTTEIAALPQLMLLREVVGTIWWAGRRLDGRPQRATARIVEMEALASWLQRHEGAFAAALR